MFNILRENHPGRLEQCWRQGRWRCTQHHTCLSISRMGEVAGGACWKVWVCLWRMCGWMRLKLCRNVKEIHGKAMQVLQGRSEPPRHSKQPSQASSHPPLTYPRARYVKQQFSDLSDVHSSSQQVHRRSRLRDAASCTGTNRSRGSCLAPSCYGYPPESCSLRTASAACRRL